MKSLNLKVLSFLFLFFCYSIQAGSGRSWRMPEGDEPIGTIKLIGVTVDSGSGWGSLEKEVAAIAPLYFRTKGFKTVTQDDHADYAAGIYLWEREFTVGWRTKKSLAMEVHIWECGNGGLKPEHFSGKLPVAAGRIVITGNKTFSSSKFTEKVLSKTISRTIRRLLQARQG